MASEPQQSSPGIDFLWYTTAQGRNLISSLRQPVGLLEKSLPFQNTSYEILEFKILLCGKSGVGKTSLVSKLMNGDVLLPYYETSGVQVSTLSWPVKLIDTGLIIIVKLNLWDVGDRALTRYNHFNSLCRKDLDGIIFLFSFTDKSSFTDVIKKVALEESRLCKFVVGSKLDCTEAEVSLKEVNEFEEFWQNKVFASPPHRNTTQVKDFAKLLNNMCFQLLKQKSGFFSVH